MVLMAAGEGVRFLGTKGRLGIDLQVRPCLPWRLYLITPFSGDPYKGQIIAFDSEKMRIATRSQAGKIVKGLPGDHVRVTNHVLFLNGKEEARLYLCDGHHRPEFCNDREYVVPPNEYLVFGLDEYSFDSRYWNTLKRWEITGSVRPLSEVIKQHLNQNG